MTDSWIAKKRYRVDLPDLITQGEQNYMRLMRLMSLLGEADQVRLQVGNKVDNKQGEYSVTLSVLERCRYTTEVGLQQDRLHSLLPGPCLVVRLYHDARLAEVIEVSPFSRVSARHEYPNRAMHQRNEKQQWSHFLGEWLRHVQDHGRTNSDFWCERVGASND